MDLLRDLWARDKAVVIVFVIALLAILYYVYKQNNGTMVAVTTDSNMPTTETDQLSTILAALGQLTPVTNSITTQLPPITTTITPPTATVTNTITNSASVAQVVLAGIGNDTARDAAILAAEKKYPGSGNAAALQAAIAAIQKQYPRSGPTI